MKTSSLQSPGHTPGPWHAHNTHGNDEPQEFDGLTVQSDFGLVTRLPEASDAENQANARLIAAAPDLLARLKEMTDLAESWWEAAGKPVHGTEPAIWEARAAIAKAEGSP